MYVTMREKLLNTESHQRYQKMTNDPEKHFAHLNSKILISLKDIN